MSTPPLRPGDRVKVREDAEHTFRVFLGETATVRDVRVFGTPRRPWCWLEFPSGRRTWLPIDRLERVTEATRNAT